MTCEVVVLNRLGLSLAADSAVTFNSQDGGNSSKTYSSGANKIFQLTTKEPVGVMVYNNAALQGVPWELIIKSFRAHFGANQCPQLSDYKAELANFIEQHQELFPASHKEAELKKLFAKSALIFVAEARARKPILLDTTQAQLHAAEWANLLQDLSNVINGSPLAHFFSAADVTNAQATYGNWLSGEISTYVLSTPDLQHLSGLFADPAVASLVIEGAFKFYLKAFGSSYTGVVLAGYGRDEFFPAFQETKYYGFVGNRLVWHEESSVAIDHERGSAIEAFARQSMVETFLVGAAPSIWNNARHSFKRFAEQACENILVKANATLPPADIEPIVANALNSFEDEWQANATNTHYAPLLQVVSGLTVEELAELSETLVMLESLKEKVTSRTQSVGGPVDVAVITKSEGLVWIKRKLFFSPELNHRYFTRQT